MKILSISVEYPPLFVGGISLHAKELNSKLSQHVDVMTICFGKCSSKLQFDSTENVYRLPFDNDKNLSYEEKYEKQNQILYKYSKEILNFTDRPDFILLHGYFLCDSVIKLSTIYDIPIIYYVHTVYSNGSSGDAISISEREIFDRAKTIIYVSDYIKQYTETVMGKSYFNSVVIPKAIDTSKYSLALNKFSQASFLYVGRISEEKGFDLLLNALGNISSEFVMYVIGEFASDLYKHKIISKMKSLGLVNNIFYLGYRSTDEIIYYLNKVDLLIVPSQLETFGKIAIEGMASNANVLVSDTSGLGPIIDDGITGLKFIQNNEKDLLNKLNLFLSMDINSKRKMVDEANKVVSQKYDWSNILPEILNVLKR